MNQCVRIVIWLQSGGVPTNSDTVGGGCFRLIYIVDWWDASVVVSHLRTHVFAPRKMLPKLARASNIYKWPTSEPSMTLSVRLLSKWYKRATPLWHNDRMGSDCRCTPYSPSTVLRSTAESGVRSGVNKIITSRIAWMVKMFLDHHRWLGKLLLSKYGGLQLLGRLNEPYVW